MSEAWAKAFYNTTKWKRVRKLCLIRDNYLCKCGEAANEVHHKIHLTPQNVSDSLISLNLDNLISLCTSCHNSMHERFSECTGCIDGLVFDEDGNLISID